MKGVRSTIGAPRRWAVLALLAGGLVGALWAAPASWAARSIHGLTQGRLQLADARGTLWNGQATVVLTAGEGSRDSRALPQRLRWSLSPLWSARTDWKPGFRLELEQACCLAGRAEWTGYPSPEGLHLHLTAPPAADGAWGRLPLSWFAGLGAPWNTLQASGEMQFSGSPLGLRVHGGALTLDGQLQVRLSQVASRVSTLPQLGSYTLGIVGGEGLSLQLASDADSALLLQGQGQWRPGASLEFRGSAQAAPGREDALNNLLNIIGRREGARSVISFG